MWSMQMSQLKTQCKMTVKDWHPQGHFASTCTLRCWWTINATSCFKRWVKVKSFFSLRWPFCRQWHFPRLIEVHPNQAIRVQIFQLHQKVYFQRMSLLILTWSDWAVMKHQLYVVLWWCWCPRHMIYLSSWPCYHDQMENNGMLHAWKFLRHCPSSWSSDLIVSVLTMA